MTTPQLPLLDDIISKGIDALIAARPSAAPHVVSGEYSKVIAGWRAQLSLVLEYISTEIKASRLPLAEGTALLQLVASEYLATITSSARAAIGQAVMQRTVVNTLASGTGAFAPGVIKKGTRFTKRADPSASPAIVSAEYESIEPVYCDANATHTAGPIGPNYTHTQSVTALIRASSDGEGSNRLQFANGFGTYAPIVLADVLFDGVGGGAGYTKFAVISSDAAGGSSGISDAEVRTLAKSIASGQFAPTAAALIAGALTETGVAKVVSAKDPTIATQVLRIADRSWCASSALQSAVAQRLRDNWQGWGCRVSVSPLQSKLIAVQATVLLADVSFSSDTFEIRDNVRKALLAYFDDRPDFNVWKTQAVRAVIAHADSRILTCTAATIVDGYTNVALTEPSAADAVPYHYFLADSGVALTFNTPS